MAAPKAKIRLEAEPALGPGISKALRDIEGLGSSAKRVLGGAFAGISVATIAGLARETLQFGDSLNAARIKAGLTGEAISELAYAAKQSNVELSGLSNSFRVMQKSLSEATTGGKEQLEVLKALGLSVEDLKGLKPDEQFELIGDRISKLADPADRARAAMGLLGKSGAELLPLFEDGAEGIRKLREEAQKIGQSFSDEQLKQLDAANDSIDRMQSSFSALAVTLVSKVAPGLERVFNKITEFVSSDNISKLESLSKLGFLASNPITAPLALINAVTGGKTTPLEEYQVQARRLGDGPPGFRPDPVLEEYQIRARARFDRTNFVGVQRTDLFEDVDQIIRETRDRIRDQFSQELLDSSEDTAKKMADIFEKPFGELTVYSEQAARNMQSHFADYLFDPFDEGLDGMLKGFIDVIRRMVAEMAAAKIFGSKKSGGFGFGDFLTGAFGGVGSGIAPGENDWFKKVIKVPDFSKFFKLPGFATGGRFTVSGSGGTDSQVVAFRATPGEDVSISPPGGGRGGGRSDVIVNYMPRIDARGATTDFIKALPAILKEHKRDVEATVIEGLRRGRYAF